MSRFLIVLDPGADDVQRAGALTALADNGGEVVALLDPVAVIAEGDNSAQAALTGLEGTGVLAVDADGTLDPAGLGLTDDQALLVSAWTGTFGADVQDALANRFRDGEGWDFATTCDGHDPS
jgi:hypothetical protein